MSEESKRVLELDAKHELSDYHTEALILAKSLARQVEALEAKLKEVRVEQQADEKALGEMQLVVEQVLNYCERKALGMSNISLKELEYQCRKVLGKPTEGLGHD